MTRSGQSLLFLAALFLLALAAISTVTPGRAQGNDPGYLPPPDNGAPRPITPRSSANDPNPGYGQPYTPPEADAYRHAPGEPRDDAGPPPQPGTYSSNEILDAGHHFFGAVSKGLAEVVEYAFRKHGRPNGYILGEEGSGAILAGLRYGEGTLYTKSYGVRKIYWQGPSLGYDFGANGSKTLTLIYNLSYPEQLYERFAGIDGSAYFVAGAGITFQQHEDVILAPIRAGVGLRLGANVGYLKYTPSPTWNPF